MGYGFGPQRGVARKYDRGTVRSRESDVHKRDAVKAVDDWQGRLALWLATELRG